MASTWDIISSVLFLAIFLGVVYLAVKFSSVLSTSTSQASTSLQSKGVVYNDGKLSVSTNRAAPSREEYIANTQAAFERGGKMMKAHKDAFSFGKADAQPEAQASSVDVTPDRKGFRRTKKLA
ncbi:hypothetical protein IAU60_006593 [Kwoniella sp. DSM 27419]